MSPAENARALRAVQDRPENVKIGRLRFWIQRAEEMSKLADQARANLMRWRELEDQFPEDQELRAVAYRRARSEGYEFVRAMESEIQRLLNSLSKGGDE